MPQSDSLLKSWVRLGRPHQWIKNGFVFFPQFFAGQILNPDLLVRNSAVFVLMCVAASGVYVLNDAMDVTEDREHPVKRYRPIASGRISARNAFVASAVLLLTAIVGACGMGMAVAGLLSAYIAMNIAYTIRLKHIPILDVVIIAVGFVLRILMGAGSLYISMWIVLLTFLLALFLGFAKRRDDVILAGKGAEVRRNISGYNLAFIDASTVMSATIVVVSYVFYTIDQSGAGRIHSPHLYLTVVFVIMGILRYLQLMLVAQATGSPTMILLKDRFLQLVGIAWLASFLLILY
ncbi:decaprenyl-phosphate phosphoribosyltransferase [bacterium]|nr:decaprenyl-phosphate phosphoribosyltransferase [bacterium]